MHQFEIKNINVFKSLLLCLCGKTNMPLKHKNTERVALLNISSLNKKY